MKVYLGTDHPTLCLLRAGGFQPRAPEERKYGASAGLL